MRKRGWWFAGLALALLAACVGVWKWSERPADRFLFLRGHMPLYSTREITGGEVLIQRTYNWKQKYWVPLKIAEGEMRGLGAEVKHTPKDVGRWWDLDGGRLTVMIGPGRLEPTGIAHTYTANYDAPSFEYIHACVFEVQPLNPWDRLLRALGVV